MLLISTFGENNFKEIKEITGISLNYPSIDASNSALQKYKNVQIKSEKITLNFPDAIALFRHIRESGAQIPGRKFRLNMAILARFEKEFQNTLTYEPIYIFAQK